MPSLPGIELTTQHEGRVVHLVAYGFDPEHPEAPQAALDSLSAPPAGTQPRGQMAVPLTRESRHTSSMPSPDAVRRKPGGDVPVPESHVSRSTHYATRDA